VFRPAFRPEPVNTGTLDGFASADPKNTRGKTLFLSRMHWVRPRLIAEVTYLTGAADGFLRHVVYKGRREDNLARDVHRAG